MTNSLPIRRTSMTKFFVIIAVVIVAFIVGCGGGGEDTNTPPTCPSGEHWDATQNKCVQNPDITPPTVVITAPTADTNIVVGTTVTLTATVSDPGAPTSGIDRVDFKVNNTIVCTTTDVTYGLYGGFTVTCSWIPTTPGSFPLTAISTDKAGNSSNPASVNLKVNDPPVDICAQWRSDLDNRAVKGCPSQIGPQGGIITLYVNNGVCMAKMNDLEGALLARDPASQVVYTSPPVTNQLISMTQAFYPFTGLYTCVFQ